MSSRRHHWWQFAVLAAMLSACADGADPPGDDGDATVVPGDMLPDPDPDMALPPDPDMATPPDPDAGGCVPADETCNGQDDDCDGTADEDFADLGESCEVGVGACLAGGTIQCRADGSGAACNATAGDPTDEVCDGEDNDCNGEIDDVEGAGEACSAGAGACAADGVLACDAETGELACDATAGEPGDEVCNGEDDDCDGNTDEEIGGGPCETGQPGACGAGILGCEGGEPSCLPVADPSIEVCDGIDNDCNGVVDDAEGIGEACSDGEGACAADGVTACGPDGVVCNAVPGDPIPELCDGEDNDCNGIVDDVPGTGDACAEGIGACRTAGVIACGPEGLACDAVPGEPADEVCDGADNDCNGIVDDVAGLGEACTVGRGACATDGVTECGPNGVVCGAEAGDPLPEVCDGIDNDCNGVVDDAPECDAEICDNGQDDDGDGQADCDDPDCADAPNCRPDEICDNEQDDDGDGQADCDDPDCVDAPNCQPVGPEICDRIGDEDGNGLADCDDPACINDPFCAPDPEICDNGEDDDGDGQADCDDPDCVDFPACLPPNPEVCDNGQDDDGDGQADCDDADCVDAPNCQPDPEICDNGADDDGDGQIDCDDADCVDAPNCQPDPEICDNGQDDDGNGLADCDDPACLDFPDCRPPQPEICDNGQDDDGDGQTDCADDDCVNDPFCVVDPEICDNGQDDDGDGQADCDDPDCADFPGCEPPDPEICDNGQDDDGDGQADCDDPDCIDAPNCLPPAPEICDDGIDNDDDGAVDCADIECRPFPGCQPDLTPIADPGGSVELAGVIDVGSPTFDRPNADCGGANGLRRYRAYRIVNETGADQIIDIDAQWNAGDGYLFVYQAPFDADAPQANCIAGNDDDPNVEFSALDGVEIADGEELVVVATTFGADADVGPFAITVSTRVPPEVCDNGLDDDGDGNVDCEDDDCVGFPACIIDEATPIADQGDSIELAGALNADSPTFDRPEDDCGGANADRRYQAFRIVNDTGADQRIDIDASWIAGDGFLLLYGAPFDPAAPQNNCVIGNDDADGLAFSALADQPIADGQELVIVATTFGPDADLGPFTITVTTLAPPQPEICDNGEDDDGDGQADCTDADCADFPGCVEICDNGADDDGDGLADCGDDDCADAPNCQGPTPIAPPGGVAALQGVLDENSPTYDREGTGCAPSASPDRRYQTLPIVNNTGADQVIQIDARWNAGDGFLFVYRTPFDPAVPEANCIDGNDDFGGVPSSQLADVAIADGEVLVIVATSFDANTDVGPFDISVSTLLPPEPEICDNGADDDGDGLSDCDDDDCADFPACIPPEVCDNGADDDGDGDIDCDDDDCVDAPNCQPEVCDNGVDDNGDGAVDCADARCVDFVACAACPAVDFEAGIPGDFQFGGDADWFVDGGQAISGDIGDNQSSTMSVAVSTPNGGRVRFAYRVSSELNFDFLRFFVDGEQIETWSGDSADVVEFALAPGDHVLEWAFTKDVSADGGEDRALVDDIVVSGAAQCPGVAVPEVCDNGRDDDGDGLTDCADDDCADFPACAAACEAIDFEGGVIPDAFQFGGDADWFVDGGQASSGDVDDNQSSRMTVAVSTPNGGRVTFDYRVSSENGFDFLRFFVDGQEQDEWSGEDAGQAGFDLAPGDHVLEWAFEKDISVSDGEDRGLIDNVLVDGAEPCIDDGGGVGPDPEVCDDGADNDGDGATDCDDADCADFPACGPAPIAAPGASIALGGQLDANSPTWSRQNNDCAGGVNPDRRYQTFAIVNETGADQQLTVTGTWNEGDGYLFVYDTPFDAAAPDVGCLAGNDDFVNTGQSQVTDVPIAAGQTLVVVATTWGSDRDLGPFDIEVATQAQPLPPGELIAAPGESIALQGQLDADSPVWNRPTGACNDGNSPDRRYQTFDIVNGTGADQLLTITGVWNAGDGYIFAYSVPFDPAQPQVGCIDGNDDFGSTAESRITDVAIPAGTALTVVVSTWGANADLGPYDVTVLTQ